MEAALRCAIDPIVCVGAAQGSVFFRVGGLGQTPIGCGDREVVTWRTFYLTSLSVTSVACGARLRGNLTTGSEEQKFEGLKL